MKNIFAIQTGINCWTSALVHNAENPLLQTVARINQRENWPWVEMTWKCTRCRACVAILIGFWKPLSALLSCCVHIFASTRWIVASELVGSGHKNDTSAINYEQCNILPICVLLEVCCRGF